MGVHITDRHGDTGAQAHAGGHGRGQFASLATQGHGRAELINEVFQLGVEGLAEVPTGEAPLGGPNRFVARRAGVAGLDARELPHDPVGRFNELGGGVIDLRGLVSDLGNLGEQPFRGNLAAVLDQPGLATFRRQGVEAVSPRLRGMVLPQLGPGVGVALPSICKAQRRAIRQGRQDRAGGEVGTDSDDLGRIDFRLGEDGPGRNLQHGQVIRRVLKCPIMAEDRAIGQGLIEHHVGIGIDRTGDFATGGDIH